MDKTDTHLAVNIVFDDEPTAPVLTARLQPKINKIKSNIRDNRVCVDDLKWLIAVNGLYNMRIAKEQINNNEGGFEQIRDEVSELVKLVLPHITDM